MRLVGVRRELEGHHRYRGQLRRGLGRAPAGRLNRELDSEVAFRSVTAADLRRFTAEASVAAGVAPAHVPYLVEGLVEATLRGIDAHGVYRLPHYLRGFREGFLNAAPRVTTVRSKGAITVLDGDNGLGVVVGQLAMERAADLASECGIGMVAVRNSNHSGMLAAHVLVAARRGMIGHFLSNAPALMAPSGGSRAILSNGPLAWAVPRASHEPIVLDMACSAAARSKIRLAAREGRRIPKGWAVGDDGEPTTDPRLALSGALLPFGGHKGYGLTVINEILSGALPGARLPLEMSTAFLAEDATTLDSWGAGHLALALEIEAFGERASFDRQVEALVDSLRSAGRDGNEILPPGEPESRTRVTRLGAGVPLSERVLDDLRQLAEELGVPPVDEAA
ncbi:MAG: Ldh family oxidoreductase [Gemmatimonas sp.]|nr:Ldh family oxidoreductase [Gemmatimonas sp.]